MYIPLSLTYVVKIISFFTPDLPVPLTTIEDAGSNTAGQSYTLTCMATLVEGLSITPDIQWMGPNGSYIVGDGSITISDLELVEGVVASRSLTFSVLLTSHGGEYTCRANLSLPGSSAQHVASNETFNVTVQSKPSQYSYASFSFHNLFRSLSLSFSFLHNILPSYTLPSYNTIYLISI